MIEMLKNQDEIDEYFMEKARITASKSYCLDKKVGAVLVKNNEIIAFGKNGTAPKMPDVCGIQNSDQGDEWMTIHAEMDLLSKIASSGYSSEDCSLYVTYAPCKECSKLIVMCGIKRVIYDHLYKDIEGIRFLLLNDVIVKQLDNSNMNTKISSYTGSKKVLDYDKDLRLLMQVMDSINKKSEYEISINSTGVHITGPLLNETVWLDEDMSILDALYKCISLFLNKVYFP